MVAGLALLARSSRADVPCSRQAHCVLAGLGRGRSCYSEDRGPCVCDNWVFNIGPLGGPRYGWPRQGHPIATPGSVKDFTAILSAIHLRMEGLAHMFASFACLTCPAGVRAVPLGTASCSVRPLDVLESGLWRAVPHAFWGGGGGAGQCAWGNGTTIHLRCHWPTPTPRLTPTRRMGMRQGEATTGPAQRSGVGGRGCTSAAVGQELWPGPGQGRGGGGSEPVV